MTRPGDPTSVAEKLRAMAWATGAYVLAWVRLFLALPGHVRRWWKRQPHE